MAEAIAFLKTHLNVVPWAGGTLLSTRNDRHDGDKPVSILDLDGIPELTVINRSDRYLELGSCVSLSAILSLPFILPLGPLRGAARLVGTATVRNLATIGGNLAARDSFMTCFAALACMDAAVEIRDAGGSRWISIHGLINDDDRPGFPATALLTRVRIPTLPWDSVAVCRLGELMRGEPCPATFVAAARFEKETISELRLLAAGLRIVRDRTLELSLVGKKLPLSARDIETAESSASYKAAQAGFGETRSRLYGHYVAVFLSGSQR
jgi:CO/xanthine dehydrogenase FAD-binding subunit